MNHTKAYFEGLSTEIGRAWNRFWFSPSDPLDLCVLRIFVGGLALAWQLSYTPDLIRWFGPDGWFDGGVLARWLTTESPLNFSGRLSFLYTPSAAKLWAYHVASSLVLLGLALGLFTRMASILSFIVVLSYIHRAPFVCSATELVISMLIGYLCLAPCGQLLSLDARWRRTVHERKGSWTTIARRLLQVHLVAIYAVMALSKLGAATWWNGEAIWWLSAQPLSRSWELSGLRQVPLLLNLWTYFVLAAEFGFVVCVWNPWLRPLALAAATASWISIGIATGNFALPLTMVIANLVFVPSELWREIFTQHESAASTN